MYIAITTDDVKTRLAGPELVALQTAGLATSQADPLPEIIQQVVREVRGYVKACAKNAGSMGAGATIPDELLGSALAMIRWKMISRLPKTPLATEQRRDEYKDAIAHLKQVAACQFEIEPAPSDAVSTEVVAVPRPRITKPERNFSREAQSGL